MALVLCFDQTKLPRSMTYDEWKAVDRWRRIAQRRLKEQVDEQIKMLSAFGSTAFERRVKEDLMNQLINPPLLMGPYQ